MVNFSIGGKLEGNLQKGVSQVTNVWGFANDMLKNVVGIQ